MKKILTVLVVTVVCLSVGNAYSEQGRAVGRGAWREKMRADLQKVKDARDLVGAIEDAKEAGDRAKVAELTRKLDTTWNSVPKWLADKVEERHPGTRVQMKDFIAQSKHAYGIGAAPSTSGRTVSHAGTTVYSSGSATHSGTTTDGSGEVVGHLNGSSVRDGNTITHEHTITNADGETLRTANSTTTRTSQNSWELDKTITLKDGRQITVEGTGVRDGNTVDIDKTMTNAKGETFTFDGTAVKDGNTINRDGTWTNADGETVRTVDGTAVRDGDTVTRDGTAKDANGNVVREYHGTSVRDGNTVTHEGTMTWRDRIKREGKATATKDGNTTTVNSAATWTRKPSTGTTSASARTVKPKASYKDDYDVFGNRPTRTKGKAGTAAKSESARPTHGTARKSAHRTKRTTK